MAIPGMPGPNREGADMAMMPGMPGPYGEGADMAMMPGMPGLMEKVQIWL